MCPAAASASYPNLYPNYGRIPPKIPGRCRTARPVKLPIIRLSSSSDEDSNSDVLPVSVQSGQQEPLIRDKKRKVHTVYGDEPMSSTAKIARIEPPKGIY